MNIVLGFDFAKSTGIAVWRDGRMESATQVKLLRTGGLMFLEFQEMVRKELHAIRRSVSKQGVCFDHPAPQLVVAYEKARRHLGVQQAHLAGAWEAILLMEVATINNIPARAIGDLSRGTVGTYPKIVVHQVEVHLVKKLAAGRTDARKEEVVAAAVQRWPHLTFSVETTTKGRKKKATRLEDAADAAFVALEAARELGWT